MARYKYTRDEQETIFRFDANRDTVNVFTAYPAVKRKLDRLGFNPRKVGPQAEGPGQDGPGPGSTG